MGGSDKPALDSILKKLAEASKPFANKNIRDGWPQLNNFGFAAMLAKDKYPQLYRRIHLARLKLKVDPSTENAKELFESWKAICRKVRENRL